MFDSGWVSGLDAVGACEAIGRTQDELREREWREIALAAHWAVLQDEHTLPSRPAGVPVPAGAEGASRPGGQGTPRVAEFACAELALQMGTGFISAYHLMADALDLAHRHPRLWAALREGRGRVWKARKVAKMTRAAGLTRDQARTVDAATTAYVDSLAWASFERLVAAEIIAVDPAAAEERRRARELEQFVSAGQSDEHGLKTLIARAEAGEVIVFIAVCDRIAQILLLEGDRSPVGARRARAVGILAQPAQALAMLQRHAAVDPAEPAGAGQSEPEDEPVHEPADESEDRVEEPVEEPEEAAEEAYEKPAEEACVDAYESGEPAEEPTESGEPAEELEEPVGPPPCPTCGHGPGATPFPVDPDKLRPKAVLHLRISEEALRTRRGVCVLENDATGPITVAEAIDLLGHCQVTIRPILDLREQLPVDCYEIPAAMRETLRLTRPSSVFPYTHTGTHTADLDHTIAYLPPEAGGPPGQTRIDNLGPMVRFAHRIKTHGRGWRHHQPHPGTYLWRTPHGYRFRVDKHGTHPLGREPDSILEQRLLNLLAAA